MKRLFLLPLTSFLLVVSPVWAGTLTWDITPGTVGTGDSAITGGTGTWDTASGNWTTDAGANNIAWDVFGNHTAVFSGTTGTVTLAEPITAGAMNLNAAYTIANGGFSLALTSTGSAINGAAAATLSGTGTITVAASQKWTNSSGTLTVSSPVDLGGNVLTLETKSNNLDVTGKISGSGGLAVTSTYTSGTTPAISGAATLANTNDYTGTTTLTGWIWLNSGGLAAFGADTSDIEFNNGGVRLTGTGSVTRGIKITGTSGISKVSGDTTLNGRITGSGNFQPSANFGVVGRIILAAANDFTGDCLNGPDGTVRLAHVDALSAANLRWLDNNGRSIYDLNSLNLAYVIGGLKSVGNNSNTLNLGSGTGGGGDGLVSFGSNNQSNTYVGILSGSAGFKKIGTGVQTLIGTNTNTGNTVVAGGTLKFGKVGGQTGVACTTGTTGTNVKRLTVPSTANLYIGQGVSGPLIPANSFITGINTSTQVTLNNTPTSANTPTTVDFADLLGSFPASASIDVQGGAILDVTDYPFTVPSTQTLGGTGTVQGAVTVNGTLAPALGGAGTLTTGDVTLSSSGIYACTLDGAGADLLAAAALTVPSGAKLSFAVVNPPTSGSYVIATFTSGTPVFDVVENLPDGYSLDYTTAGQIRLVAGAVSPYDQWATDKNLTPSNKGLDQDPDHDGSKNITEFALGGNPLAAGDVGPSLVKVRNVEGSPALTLTMATRAGTAFDTGSGPRQAAQDGVNYRVEGGSNLAGWSETITEVKPALTDGLPAAPSGYEYHTFRTPGPVATTPKDFIRVKVND